MSKGSQATYSNTHAEIQQNIMRFQNHITGLCETNVNWRNYGFRDSWERKMQAGFTTLYFSHSSCNEGNLHVLQQGGCSLLTTNRIGLKITQRGQDHEMGRWAWKRFKLKGDQHMSVVTAYQVSQKSSHGFGMETAYMQQWRILKQRGSSCESLQSAFWQDLHAQISIFQSNGDEIILILYANLASEDADLGDLVSYLGLVDFHMNLHEAIPPETNRRGRKKIDFIFG